MLGESHELQDEFPEHREHIAELLATNSEFARLFGEYQAVNGEVIRSEQGIEVHADDYLEGLKMKRVALKDQLYALLHGQT
jgi:uncharacterized protein YdcH (DUF465 family)